MPKRRRRSKPESDDERVWLGGDGERDDAARKSNSSSSTDSDRSEVGEAITGGFSSPTKAAVARKTKPKVVDDDERDPPLGTGFGTSTQIVCEPNNI